MLDLPALQEPRVSTTVVKKVQSVVNEITFS